MLFVLIGLLAVGALLLLIRPLIGAKGQGLVLGLLGAAVLGGGIGLYLLTGAPQIPDQGYKDRMAELRAKDPRSMNLLEIEHVLVDRTRSEPEDSVGWGHLARVRMAMGRYQEAAEAFGRVLDLTGPDVDTLVRLGEALVLANEGSVTPDARRAFAEAERRSPEHPGVLYYAALDREQTGSVAEAIAEYKKLMAGAEEPWNRAAATRLAMLDADGRLDGGLDGAPGGLSAAQSAPQSGTQPQAGSQPQVSSEPRGPDAAAMAAAADMAPEDRMAMIEGMVARLSARLEDNPGDVEGWLRLIRSYRVLGKPDDLDAAIERARTALADNPEALDRINKSAAGTPSR